MDIYIKFIKEILSNTSLENWEEMSDEDLGNATLQDLGADSLDCLSIECDIQKETGCGPLELNPQMTFGDIRTRIMNSLSN